MSDTVKEQEMISVEKAGELIQDAVNKTAEVVSGVYAQVYDKDLRVSADEAELPKTKSLADQAEQMQVGLTDTAKGFDLKSIPEGTELIAVKKSWLRMVPSHIEVPEGTRVTTTANDVEKEKHDIYSAYVMYDEKTYAIDPIEMQDWTLSTQQVLSSNKSEETVTNQPNSKENEDMKVSAETKQVVPGGPDKPLVSGVGKPTDKIKAPHGQFPDVPGYEAVEKIKAPIEPAKAGKDSLTTKHDGDNAKLVNQSDAFIKSLMSARGLQTGIDMKKKIWAMLQKPEGAKLLAKVVRTASLVGEVRTGAALDFIAAKKKLNTTK